MSRHFKVIGNWKMNKTIKEALEFARALPALFAPSYLAVPYTCIQALKNLDIPMLEIGAQNLYPELDGPFTGEISPVMLKEAGANFVLVGHSERRQYFHETNSFINEKVKAALLQELIPILCIGETGLEKEHHKTEEVLKTQLYESLKDIDEKSLSQIFIAYEPIWAIGTGKPATAQAAQETHYKIRQMISEKWSPKVSESIILLYGGSVTDKGIEDFAKQPDIDGVLVGGASLKPEIYSQIIARVGGKHV